MRGPKRGYLLGSCGLGGGALGAQGLGPPGKPGLGLAALAAAGGGGSVAGAREGRAE